MTDRSQQEVDMAAFGFTLNRLSLVTSGAPGLVCTEAQPAGAPLLALPLSQCWTKQAVERECPVVARALEKAARRSPKSELLRSDTTSIALHLVHVRRSGQVASRLRHAHLSLLPARLDTLLAWSSEELESLKGSWWLHDVQRRQAKVKADFLRTQAELGPEVTTSLGLDEAAYTWARQVIQQFGLHFWPNDESHPFTLLAPGLELLSPDDTEQPNHLGLRVHFTAAVEPALVLYADRDYQAGDRVVISHDGLACSNFRRLLENNPVLTSNPWDFVPIVVTLDCNDAVESVADRLSDAFMPQVIRQVLPGCFAEADAAEGWSPVEVLASGRDDGSKEVQLNIRLTRDELVPDAVAAVALGSAVLVDERLGKELAEEEEGIENVLGEEQCEMRALRYLQRRLEELLAGYPADGKQKIASKRAEQAYFAVAEERKLAVEALEKVRRRLAAGDLSSPPRDVMAARTDARNAMFLERARLQLVGCAEALNKLSGSFHALLASGEIDQPKMRHLHAELGVLRNCLGASTLGDPLGVAAAPKMVSSHSAIRAQGDALRAVCMAGLAQNRCEVLRLRKDMERAVPEAQAALCEVHRLSALTYKRLMDFTLAKAEFKKSSDLALVKSGEVSKLMKECAMALAQSGDEVLAGAEGMASELYAVKEKLRVMGYFRIALEGIIPERMPVPLADSDALQRYANERDSRKLIEKALDVFGTGPKAGSNRSDVDNLLVAFRLFFLREFIPLSQLLSVLGRDVCCTLLRVGALSCYRNTTAELLSVAEGEAAAQKAKSLGSRQGIVLDVEVFANVVFWPVGGDVLVATDIDASAHMENTNQPVLYLAHDSRALLAAVDGLHPASHVLDACCGCGVHGIVALKKLGAKTATFLHSNPRALQFARFNTVLNGVQDSAEFVQGRLSDGECLVGRSFDAMLACLPFMPNPEGIVTNSGPMYMDGEDGCATLGALVARAAAGMLSPGGRLCAAATLPNADHFPELFQRWLPPASGEGEAVAGASCCAALFRADAHPAFRLCNGGMPAEAMSSLQRALLQQSLSTSGCRMLSPALLVLAAVPTRGGHSKAPPGGSRQPLVVVREERSCLWSDVEHLRAQVPRALELLMGHSQLDVLGVEDDGETLYSLDWDSGEGADSCSSDDTRAPAAAAGKRAGAPAGVPAAAAGKSHPRKKNIDLQDRFTDGATWKDIQQLSTLGFAIPVLAETKWEDQGSAAAVPITKLRADAGVTPSVAVCELRGMKCPVELREALADTIDVSTRISFDGVNIFKSQPALNFDTLIVPLIPDAYLDRPFHELSAEVLTLLQVLAELTEPISRTMRILFLTCGAAGPTTLPNFQDRLHPASPVMGLARVSRLECPQLLLMHLDSDDFTPDSDCVQVASQIAYELDLISPYMGPKDKRSDREKMLVFLKQNREVAYRAGKRFTFGVHISPQGPIYPNRKALPLPDDVAAGVALITGGLGGLGIVTAEALVEAGLRCVVLSSRSGRIARDGQGLEERLAFLERSGCRVVKESCDASNEKQVVELLQRIRTTIGPLTMVIHTAGVLEDRMFLRHDRESLEKSFAPKAVGGWALHKHTLQDKLHTFMVFSSVAAQFGNRGQANYAASNVWMDELCRLRVSMGLPGVSIGWPGVEEVGMAAAMGDNVKLDPQWFCKVGHVKQAVRQLVGSLEPVGPVQVVCPEGNLKPVHPLGEAWLKPLLRKASKEFLAQLNEEAEARTRDGPSS